MKIGTDAIIAADFPIEFAGEAAAKSYALQSCLSIRAGQPPNVDKPYAVSPKPMSVKTKTTSSSQGLPLVAGFIPVDQATFGRSHSKPLPDNCEAVQLRMTLKELLKDAAAGKYEITSLSDGKLEFKSKLPDNEHYDEQRVNKNEITFRIDLVQGKSTELSGSERDSSHPWHDSNDASMPDYWSDALGDFDQNALYSVEYKLPNNDYQPLQLAAIGGRPITGDADMLSVAVPLDMERKGHGTMYNAYIPSERAALVEDFIHLMNDLNGGKLTAQDVMAIKDHISDFVKTSGIITSYQLLCAVAVNDQFALGSRVFDLLFQHGPETNNPGPPSNLDGNMLHFYKGLPVLTQTENELVAFIMQPGFLEDHYYPVHPGWDMAKWAPVIEKQLELGQLDLINPKTLEAFDQHAKFMARMEKEAPAIERMLESGNIAQITPQQFEDFDKYMKNMDARGALNHAVHDMSKALQECGLADKEYIKNTKEFEVATQAPAAQNPAAVINNNNNNNEEDHSSAMVRRM